ncbi:prephenate dehydrogenase [Desulfonispora thiosulfatigenes DSM 11270]|uniref:Prephenate dehydrogenase n=1 Tax=Desulfonispora thiosulfatigenes DSM 11270 TaxID=656914 RepID=A0A1W1V706_DESTI|nr:prephenate dehydrogenase [Desulfonispora thiosulfatigenes]SMB89207.1 prephenate dehydrogenase [Desulfonispora thiosulfatigenes DSM 11270]
MNIKKVTIIGLGLIGGSWGLALKRTCPEIIITGVDLDKNSLNQGLELGVIDNISTSLAKGVKDADVVIISTLASSVIKVINEIIPFLKKGAIVTDTASTKQNIVEGIKKSLPDDIFYIGGHPMAGSEKQGVLGADPYLLENAVYVLAKESNTNKEALNSLVSLITKVGSKVLFLKAAEHDQKVAAISHLPHLVAAVLMNTVGTLENQKSGFFQLAAGGFRDVTRIADSHPLMWKDIFMENKGMVLSLIETFRKSLDEAENAIINENENNLLEYLSSAKKWREEVPQSSKGLLPVIFDVVVTVPDEPGKIGSLANILGQENINIMDIEILRVREGGGEVLRFGFRTEDEAKRAVKVMNQEGYLARARI